jgi:hypothetical protein
MGLLSAVLLWVLPVQSAPAVLRWQINIVEYGGTLVGLHYSLVLDAAGYPVISYYDITNNDLKLAHCNDAICSGNDESHQTVDSTGDVGLYTSLVLDAAGYPVISYLDIGNSALKLAHCNDATCSGNDESLQTVDSTGTVGLYPSLVLDAAGYPVISYYDLSHGDLKLVHCNDANCSGNDESLQTVDSVGTAGGDSSLVLDAAGYPVISYYDLSHGDLKLAHCNDATCSGNDESLQTVDSADDVGYGSSLVLDAAGYPVISYYDGTNSALKLAHCNDANCSGNDESLQTIDNNGHIGTYNSLVLDAAGYPVISYYDGTNSALKLAHCNDTACSGSDESLQTLISGAFIGESTPLVLDAAGYPVISYLDAPNQALKLMHCNDVACSGNDESHQTVDSPREVGRYNALALDAAGYPVISYYDQTNGDLKLAHCNDANCAGNNESRQTIDNAGWVGEKNTSLVLDAAGYPVISYRAHTNGVLKLAHCNDANCSGNDESLQTVDSVGTHGGDSSLVLDAAGYPVISYYDQTNGSLKLAHCNDANCTGNDESLQTVDNEDVGRYSSLALDAAGYPVISYFDGTNSALKLAHCNDANCSGNDESTQTIDRVGQYRGESSLVLDTTGYPVISYHDTLDDAFRLDNDLRLAHCNDANCSGNDESTQTVDSVSTVYGENSLVLDAAGYPVISYLDGSNGSLKLARQVEDPSQSERCFLPVTHR